MNRRSEPGDGTHVELRVPASIAYRKSGGARWSRFAGRFLGACLLVAIAPCAYALNPALDVTQYAHTAWTVRDGFVTGFLEAVAQTPDGYLWLGTEFGLLRFDGVRTVPFRALSAQDLPGADVHTILVTRDGALWIGTSAGLACWKNGRLTSIGALHGDAIASLVETRDGTVWAGTTAVADGAKLCAIRGGQAQCHRSEWLRRGVYPSYEDAHGVLWLGVDGGVVRWQSNDPTFVAVPDLRDSHPALGEGGASGLLVGTDGGLRRIVDDASRPEPLPGASFRFAATRQPSGRFGILRDRDGALWIATRDRGLLHVRGGRTDAFSEADGLSGATVVDLLEDREGTVWAVTPNGLDRFRDYTVPSVSTKQGLSHSNTLSVLAARDGAVWIGTYAGVNRWQNGAVTVAGSGMTRALLQDVRSRMWVATGSEIGYVDANRFVPVANLEGWAESIAELPAGHLWVASQEGGLFETVERRVVRRRPWSDFTSLGYGRALVADAARRGLWIGFSGGGIALLEDGAVRQSYAADNGRVNHLRFGTRGALWAATARGLTRIKDGRALTLTSRNGLPCDTVHWSMEDDDHSVWVYLACGLVQMARTDLDAWVAEPGRTIPVRLFDNSDGVRSHTYPPEVQGVTKTADGRIWFTAYDGVNVIDPGHLRTNTVAPPVRIEQVKADGRVYQPFDEVRLPPRVRDVWIDYTALSLVAAEKVRFRYRLEGQDENWKEVVNDRRVQYSNLRPGRYRFRVTASNNNGVWNETGASLDFSIAPAYSQTRWFAALVILGTAALLWMAYQLRVARLARQFNRTLEARVSERTRIARDLHDTLLQSLQGLLLQFQSVSKVIPPGATEATARLDRALDRAEAALTEGRDAVQGLRASAITVNDLANGIAAAGAELTSDPSLVDPPAISVEVDGVSRNLNPVVREEAYRITTEALRNAVKHAHARRVAVTIRYEPRQLRLTVRDDGRGMDPETIRGRHREGHFGLPGMRERADVVGGRLEVRTQPGAGTAIELRVPGATAYSSTRAWWKPGFRR